MPPEIGQSRPFRMEEISHYDERGGAWYWNNLSFGEHTGTHFDAPIHWVSGRDLPNSSTDTIPVNDLIAPAVVIDCSKESAADADFLLTPDFIRAWEAKHGKIPPRCWVLMRTDWSKKTDPAAYQNFDEVGQHTPGPDPDAVRFLLNERDVLGFGTETIGTDAGQAAHFLPPYPVPLLHARRGTLRPAMPDQSRFAAADRQFADRAAAENPERQRQPVARAGAGAANSAGAARP